MRKLNGSLFESGRATGLPLQHFDYVDKIFHSAVIIITALASLGTEIDTAAGELFRSQEL
jgi:hypothetical protein